MQAKNPVHVVATGDQKAAHREALRHMHAGLADADRNLRDILRGTVSWRARFPTAPRFALTDESSAIRTPSEATPPGTSPATSDHTVPSPFVPPWTDAAEAENPG